MWLNPRYTYNSPKVIPCKACSKYDLWERFWFYNSKLNSEEKVRKPSSTRISFSPLLNLIHNLIKCSWALLNSNNELHLKPLVILFHISFSNYPLFPIYYYFILCLRLSKNTKNDKLNNTFGTKLTCGEGYNLMGCLLN